MYINDPFKKECTGGVFDFCLNVAEVICINHVLLFLLKVSQVYILAEFSNSERVVVTLLITFWYFLEVFFLLFSYS